ncbi:hypothetical protein KGF54_001075 [Candida jiufengensis]|uniref:uncharacterized protein n=1 Tax=Candida jiufengensis TaxID=497108 RepID=UPI002224EB4D|nr:uncharacterized protein KGF54_001075 [Candida jiufengensis]KAI5956600.1 hypothetical protein KGF54_001075 [Candida jiufengensis]
MSSPPHSHSSSNYSYGPVIKPELASIGNATQSSSSSSFKSPTSTIGTTTAAIDHLPPSNLSDIESIDGQHNHYNQQQQQQQPIPQFQITHNSNISKESQKSQDSSNSIANETLTRPIIRQISPESNSISPMSSNTNSSNDINVNQRVGINLTQLQNTSSLESLLTKPINLQNAHNNHYQKRASIFSTFSQYSGKVENEKAIPMTLKRTDTSKFRKYNKDEVEEEQQQQQQQSQTQEKSDKEDSNNLSSNQSVETGHLLNDGIEDTTFDSSKQSTNQPEEEHSDVETDEESSILMGKLPTSSKPVEQILNINPDKSFNTNIEGAVPARSPRRPVSMIANPTGNSTTTTTSPKTKRNSRRKSTQINDDLDKLMFDASSMKSMNDVPQEQEEEEPINPETDSTKNARDRLHRESTDTTASQPLLAKLNDINDEPKEEQEAAVASQEFSPEPRTLPPRPSQDNINKARQLSSSYQNQQQLPLGEITNLQTNINDDDDQYYDIDDEDERIPIQHRPSKAKSVKNSIRRPTRQSTVIKNESTPPPLPQQELQQSKSHQKKKKNSSSTKKRSKSTTSNNQELKPFSYNTLISLLESMNGTIIGEEFDSLNIPIREKQLIEKIIDSLSRLTSDMILDKQRYDMGLVRLEKALRVLEGFN